MSHEGAPKRVLVTGSAGKLGRAAIAALLAAGHRVRGFDLVANPALPPEDQTLASVSDGAALQAALTGQDVLIHLAATPDDARFPRGDPPDDGDNFLTELVPNNLVGTYHALEAARRCGTGRVILASSGQVVDMVQEHGPWPATAESPVTPRYWYACTKVFLEAAGQVYARVHGITIVVVRLGWCPRDADQAATLASCERGPDVYLSAGDAGRFFAAAVAAEEVPRFSIMYACSKSLRNNRFDLNPAWQILGFRPRDQWPEDTN
jgi:nucleoside-diphosphate-sugar epimerase